MQSNTLLRLWPNKWQTSGCGLYTWHTNCRLWPIHMPDCRLWPIYMTHKLQVVVYIHDTNCRLWPIYMTHKLQAVAYTHTRLQAVAYTHDTQTSGCGLYTWYTNCRVYANIWHMAAKTMPHLKSTLRTAPTWHTDYGLGVNRHHMTVKFQTVYVRHTL